ncbi:hypothetical protein ACDY97_30295 [Rhizobium mongolense]|uniref:hypothetical protein n=1 Tax=Rhizobium mongolense TaxID=57676 RepID=UPI0035580490
MIRTLIKFGAIASVLATGTLTIPELYADDYVRGQVGGTHYSIPAVYRASVSDRSLFISASLPQWGPLVRYKPGWNDHLQILITATSEKNIAALWDRLYDGTPFVPGKPYTIVRKYRSEPNLAVQKMASEEDVFLPDQNAKTMPEGFMVCGRPSPPIFPYASCSHYFVEDHQRWKITFGRQFVGDFRSIRTRAKQFLDRFKES